MAEHRQKSIASSARCARRPVANHQLKFFRHIGQRGVIPREFIVVTQRNLANLHVKNLRLFELVNYTRAPIGNVFKRPGFNSTPARQQSHQDGCQSAATLKNGTCRRCRPASHLFQVFSLGRKTFVAPAVLQALQHFPGRNFAERKAGDLGYRAPKRPVYECLLRPAPQRRGNQTLQLTNRVD